jgi:hypothetical protein
MVPEIRHDAAERHARVQMPRAQDVGDAAVAGMTTDGSEETVFDIEEDRGYDLGEGD